MIIKAVIVALVIAVVALVWKLLHRHWSREVYIHRDYEKYRQLDEMVTGETHDVEPLMTSDPGDRSVN